MVVNSSHDASLGGQQVTDSLTTAISCTNTSVAGWGGLGGTRGTRRLLSSEGVLGAGLGKGLIPWYGTPQCRSTPQEI